MPPPLPLPPLPDSPPPATPAQRRWPGTLALTVVTLVVIAASVSFLRVMDRAQDEIKRSAAGYQAKTVLAEQEAAWNRGDLDGFMAGYWNDERLSFSSGGTVTRGWQATLDRYRKRYQADGKEMGTLTFSELDVEAIGPDVALARGRWGLVFAKSEDKPDGLFTLVMRKTPDGWKVVHDHTSAAEPPKKN